MGRVIVDSGGAARRPTHRVRALLIVVACVVLYVIGYVAVATWMKGN